MDVPEETLEQLRTIKFALDELEEHMQPFLETAPKEMTAQLTPIERVKANLALAQAVVVLYQLHRRLDAAKLDNHPIHKELERLAIYERKVAAAIDSDELARTKPGTSLNVAAANRFIDAAIPDLSAEQKQQLRSLGKRAAAEAASGTGASKRNQQQQQQQQQDDKADDALQQQDDKAAASDDVSEDNAEAGPVSVGSTKKGGSSNSNSKKSKGKGKQSSRTAETAEEAQAFLHQVLADLEPGPGH